jgi:Family of unknown function (DUF6279)
MTTMFNDMPRSFQRYGIIALLVVALAQLGACSALRFGYNQASELAYWWLDGYVDFNDVQGPRVRQALLQWHGWHRRTQLPDYVALLARVQAEASGSTAAERLCALWQDTRARIDVALEQALPAAADLMLTLTPQQLQHIERRYAKSNQEFRENYLQADAAQRLKEAVRRAVDRAESFYGHVDGAQREQIARLVAQSPFDAELWFSERRQRQADALQTLRALGSSSAGIDQARAALRGYLDRVARSPRPQYRRYAESLVQYNCALAANLHNSASPSQRQALLFKLKGWEADLRALAADATP